MPKYHYFCEACKGDYEIIHSMKERMEKCELCGSHALRILPSIPIYLKEKQENKDRKAGSIVEEYIEKNKKSVAEEKQKRKSQEYKKE